MSKRENGMGSVYKRSDIINRPWIAAAPREYTISSNGSIKSHTLIIGHYRTKREAVDALEEFRRHPTQKYNLTLQDVYNEWSASAFSRISKSTQDNYRAAWLKLKNLYTIQFRDIRTAQLQCIIDYYAGPHKETKSYGKRDNPTIKEVEVSALSSSSLEKIKALLTQLYDYACQNDIVSKNYASFLLLPKKGKSEKDAFTSIELQQIKNSIGIVPYADCIYFMCYTGWRISEFLGLTRFSWDPSSGVLTGGLKTDAGRNRTVPVHQNVLPILNDWLQKGGETIFCRPDGTPWKDDAFRVQCYYPALERIGVRLLSPHCTRHTFATLASAAGLRPEDIQAIMGHESYEITAETYIHQSNETLKRAIEKIS